MLLTISFSFFFLVISALFCEIPGVNRGTVTSQADPPHLVFVPHGQNILLECDNGYVIAGTTENTRTFECNRSDSSLPEGSFGVNWDTATCIGELEL